MSSYNEVLISQDTNASSTQPHSAANTPQMPLLHDQPHQQGMPLLMQAQQNGHHVNAPHLLHGHRCYVDASTSPDQHSQIPRTARLGIFFLLMQEQATETIYIKAKLHACTSVLMAEAAALALASAIARKFQIEGINYLSDCEQLTHFLNKEDHSNPPDWRIKPFTQLYLNNAGPTSATTLKNHRSLNSIAHSLARQAFQDINT